MKKKLCLTGVLFLFTVVNCYSSMVQWNIAGWGYNSYFDYYMLGFTVPDGTGVGRGLDVISTSMHAVLTPNWEYGTLSYGTLMLQTDYNTLIDHDLFANATGFFETYLPNGMSTSEANLEIDVYNTVFLAFAIGSHYGNDFDALWYGWIEFGYNGKNVYIVNSALETTGQGIYAGTGLVVPEPSAALLAIVGLAVLGLRRRKVT